MSEEALWRLPASRLAEKIAARKVSPIEVTQSVLDRIAQVDDQLNAFTLVQADQALAEAKDAERAVMRGEALGPLHGVPVSVKDNVWVRGDPSTSGSLLMRNFVAPRDAPAVAGLREAGTVVVGRTNMPEFAWRGTTDSPGYGPCLNPWNVARTPGGSSGGAAAAVSAGMAPLAVGTDGAGSIRIPAAFCGIVGMKPTFGHIGQFPAAGLNELAAHIGPMTRTVADCALMYRAMSRYAPCDPLSTALTPRGVPRSISGLRVAWSSDLGFVPVEPEIVDVVRAAASELGGLVAGVDETYPGVGDLAAVLDVLYGSVQAGAHAGRSGDELAQMDPALVDYARRHARTTVVDYGAAVRRRQAAVASVDQFFDAYDLLVTPTVGIEPFASDLVSPPDVHGRRVGHLDWSLCYPFNYTGQPAISVPVGRTQDGLPVGMQIVGRRHADATLLAVAEAFEQLRPWADQWPADVS